MLVEFKPAVINRLNDISFNGSVKVYPEVPRDPSYPYVTIEKLDKAVLQETDTNTIFEADLRVKLIYRFDTGEVWDKELKENAELVEDALSQPLNVSGHTVSDVHNIRDTQFRTQEEDDRTYKSALIRYEYTVEDTQDDSTYVYNPPEATYLYGSENGYQFDASGDNPSIRYNDSTGEWEVQTPGGTVSIGDNLVSGGDTEVLFNDAGSIGSSPNLKYDASNQVLDIADGQLSIDTPKDGVNAAITTEGPLDNFWKYAVINAGEDYNDISEFPTSYGSPHRTGFQNIFRFKPDTNQDVTDTPYFYNSFNRQDLSGTNTSDGYLDLAGGYMVNNYSEILLENGRNVNAWSFGGSTVASGSNSQGSSIYGGWAKGEARDGTFQKVVGAEFEAILNGAEVTGQVYGIDVTVETSNSPTLPSDTYAIHQTGPAPSFFESPIGINSKGLDASTAQLSIQAKSGQTDPLLLLKTENEDSLLTATMNGDTKHHKAGAGVILTSPDGSVTKRVRLNNNGELVTENV
jgi:hypothetical protein